MQAAALNPVMLLRRRFQRWVQARQPRSDTLLLTQRNVYILPTRPGFMLGATLLVLLVASINYQLNLGYVLTFLLAGSGVVSMHITHATLRGLTLHLKPVAPVFVGDAVLLDERDYVAPDDIQAILAQTIAHRLVPVAGAGRGRREQVRAMVEAVPLP